MKRIFAVTLLALTLWLNAASALAQGTAESPGVQASPSGETISVSVEGTAESPGYLGTAESPGFMATVMVYLGVII